MGRLADQVSDLESECDELNGQVSSLEQSLDEVEGELEEKINELEKAKEFIEWVKLAYPVIIKDYECVKVIEEKANERS